MLANCSAFNVPVSPSGVVYLTNDLLVASVSSKSKTVIPFDGLENLEDVIALFNVLLAFI